MIKNLLFTAGLFFAVTTINAQCTDWVDPTPEAGWTNFLTPPCTGEFDEDTEIELWKSEAYATTLVEGGTYSFSHCNGPGAGSWVPDYTIIAPSGAIDAFGAGDGDGCTITWTASEDGDYLIVINEAGNCGVAGTVDNGFPRLETISDGVPCGDAPVFVEGAESFEGDELPECWQIVDADGDDFNWNLISELAPSFHGDYAIRSESYSNDSGVLTPDNYLITPQLDLGTGDSLYYVIRAIDPNFAAENYTVLVSTTGTEIADFTDEVFTEVLSSIEWEGRSIDLSAYDNQTIFIAFRHHDVSDEFAFLIDAIALPGTVVCNPISTENVEAVSAKLYPNPVVNEMTVALSLEGSAEVRIFDAVGRLVVNQRVQLNGVSFSQDVSFMENGLYTIEIRTESAIATEKFIKQ